MRLEFPSYSIWLTDIPAVLVVARMRRYRKDFSAILVSSNSDLTKSRFLRLFLLSIALILTFLPVQLYTLYQNSIMPLIPYSWRLVHGQDWWRVIPVPTGGAVPFDRWIQIAVGFAVFVFFGLGQDAQKMYRQWLLKIGFGRLLPCLRHEPSSARRAFPASSQTDSFGSKANLFFRDGLSRVSMLSS